MTVFGGEESAWGTKIGGFFVTCCKCGWHSKIYLEFEDELGFKSMVLRCGHCGNKYKKDVV